MINGILVVVAYVTSPCTLYARLLALKAHKKRRAVLTLEVQDVWSHLYSLSFEPNCNWTREYPGQEEILEYLVAIAHKYQLYKYIRFNTQVDEARWDDATKTWKTQITRLGAKDAEFGSSYTVTSDFLVSGVGQLNIPKFPDIKGLDSFKGKKMHTARWDWDYDLTDKKIGIIGNGATSAQIIPEVAKVAKSLTVFQRTPNWVVPREDKEISPTKRAMFRYIPGLRRRYRAYMMDFREAFFDCVFDKDAPVHKMMEDMSHDHMAAQLPGEEYKELRDKLTPHYEVGCKRVIITDDFFPTFKRENVVLETAPIVEITPTGVTTEAGSHNFDLLVLATGFKTTQFMYPIKIIGKNGKSIEEVWKDGASAYLGMTIPELPNFAMLYGPNTNLGHNSIILMIEAQALYINRLISTVISASSPISLAPKPSVVERYNEELQARLRVSAFADPNCNSWYKNEAGLITNNWSDTVIKYQIRTSEIRWDEFDIEGEGGKTVLKTLPPKENWKRVVEETVVSDRVILGGLVMAAGAVVAGAVYRNALKGVFPR